MAVGNISGSEIEVYKVPISDYLMITGTIVCIIFYSTIPGFQSWVLLNFDYITRTLDVGFVFVLVAIIPFVVYYLRLIFRILRHFWTAYSFLKFRINLTILRFNIIYFGVASMLIASIFRIPILSWITLLCAFVLVILLNYFFISYEDIRKDQIYFEKQRLAGEKEDILIHPIIVYGLGPTLIIVIPIYFLGDGTLKAFFDAIWLNYIAIDFGFPFVFWLTISLSVLWWFIAYLIVIFSNVYQKYQNKILKYSKFLIFLLALYLIVKLFIFNFTWNMQEPYESLTSLGITGGSGLVLKFAKSKILGNPKKGDD